MSGTRHSERLQHRRKPRLGVALDSVRKPRSIALRNRKIHVDPARTAVFTEPQDDEELMLMLEERAEDATLDDADAADTAEVAVAPDRDSSVEVVVIDSDSEYDRVEEIPVSIPCRVQLWPPPPPSDKLCSCDSAPIAPQPIADAIPPAPGEGCDACAAVSDAQTGDAQERGCMSEFLREQLRVMRKEFHELSELYKETVEMAINSCDLAVENAVIAQSTQQEAERARKSADRVREDADIGKVLLVKEVERVVRKVAREENQKLLRRVAELMAKT